MSAAEPDVNRRRQEAYKQRQREARSCALQFLYQIDVRGEDELTDEDLQRFWQQADAVIPEAQESRFQSRVEALVRGIVDRSQELDAQVNACTEHWQTDRMSVTDRNILRLAAYEIMHCPDVPPVAAVDEAIELAKRFGDKDSPRFVNGILDRLLRDKGLRRG